MDDDSQEHQAAGDAMDDVEIDDVDVQLPVDCLDNRARRAGALTRRPVGARKGVCLSRRIAWLEAVRCEVMSGQSFAKIYVRR
jgi:hypothetical protein